MKKTAVFLVVLLMIFGLAACGSENQSASSQGSSLSSAQEENTASDTQSGNTEGSGEAENTAGGGNTLVVYFSATGNTEQAAQYIAGLTGGDLFELEPSEPYSEEDLDWTDDNSRVSREHDDESLRDVPLVADTVENWAEYDTVYIGYPIWWGIAAWPVDNFVKNNNFSDKTVIPFATSSSSGMGQSGTLLEEMAGTGDWQDGQRFSSGASQSDVADWVSGLDLNG